MGQPIVVNEKPSPNRGVVRFETNRAITGMGHERYLVGTEVWGERPPDVLARRLLARGGVLGVQINGNVVTVDLERGWDATGLKEIIENLYRFYPDQPAAPAGTPAAEPAEATEAAEPAEAAPAEPAADAEPVEPAAEPPADEGGASLADPVVADAPASGPEGAVAPAAPDDTLGATGTVAGDAPDATDATAEPVAAEPPAAPVDEGGASFADPVVAEAPASDPEGAVAPSAPAAADDTLGATGTVAGDAPEPGVDRTDDPA
ncbi:MAG TPA: hypothetical protein VHK88_12515 [Aquihabitans sp.]|jgi:hypothetical protein|nr:hypothetical protein [Aquihabitans sp.]